MNADAPDGPAGSPGRRGARKSSPASRPRAGKATGTPDPVPASAEARRRISDAAARLLASGGRHAPPSLADLAAAAGVSLPTLHRAPDLRDAFSQHRTALLENDGMAAAHPGLRVAQLERRLARERDDATRTITRLERLADGLAQQLEHLRLRVQQLDRAQANAAPPPDDSNVRSIAGGARAGARVRRR